MDSKYNNYIQFFINSNNTKFYVYDAKNKEILERYRSSDFSTVEINGLKIKEIIQKSDEFTFNNVRNAKFISSTVQPPGYSIINKNVINEHIFNEFLGSEKFIQAVENNKFSEHYELTMELIQENCPYFYILLKNLFFNESNEVILNFMAYLKHSVFKDKRQDIIYLFFGKSEQNQGQGAGKGILRNVLQTLLSGLVTTVSNANYNQRFNSQLENKRIVVFDEVNFKNLDYEYLKDLTGNDILTIEYKGKESYDTTNLISLLMFTNQYDLNNLIKYDDRRTFLINPNPVNGSLNKILEKEKITPHDFIKEIKTNELENLTHLIALASNKVLTPMQLRTNAHISYFKRLAIVRESELELEPHKIFIEKEKRKRFLENISLIPENRLSQSLKQDIKAIKPLLNKCIIDYTHTERLCKVLNFVGYKTKSPATFWRKTVEYAKSSGLIVTKLDLKETKKYQRYKGYVISEKPPTIEQKNLLRIVK